MRCMTDALSCEGEGGGGIKETCLDGQLTPPPIASLIVVKAYSFLYSAVYCPIPSHAAPGGWKTGSSDRTATGRKAVRRRSCMLPQQPARVLKQIR